jgi:DNA-directed RNA polymerase subunit RPC12/RpoP
MGMLFRLLAPKPLKKARRAAHPISLLTPRPVRRAKMAAVNVANPAGGAKRAAKTAVVRSVRGRGRTPTRRASLTAYERQEVAQQGKGASAQPSDRSRPTPREYLPYSNDQFVCAQCGKEYVGTMPLACTKCGSGNIRRASGEGRPPLRDHPADSPDRKGERRFVCAQCGEEYFGSMPLACNTCRSGKIQRG